MAVLQLSTGTTLNANVRPYTNRTIVRNLFATVVTPGSTGFDVCKLNNPTTDTLFQNATPANPVGNLGPEGDDILFKPLNYPEPVGE